MTKLNKDEKAIRYLANSSTKLPSIEISEDQNPFNLKIELETLTNDSEGEDEEVEE